MGNTRRLTAMALLVALLCISAYISFPLPFSPAPVTALTLVAVLIGLVLPPKDACTVLVIYVLLGAIGLPVFVGGGGGLGRIVGPTGGFIISWPVAYTLLSYLKGKKRSFISYSWRSIIITLPVVYVFGITGLVMVTGMSFAQGFMVGALPFIPGDIMKCLIASYLATRITIEQ